jgi:hypothetical protein
MPNPPFSALPVPGPTNPSWPFLLYPILLYPIPPYHIASDHPTRPFLASSRPLTDSPSPPRPTCSVPTQPSSEPTSRANPAPCRFASEPTTHAFPLPALSPRPRSDQPRYAVPEHRLTHSFRLAPVLSGPARTRPDSPSHALPRRPEPDQPPPVTPSRPVPDPTTLLALIQPTPTRHESDRPSLPASSQPWTRKSPPATGGSHS